MDDEEEGNARAQRALENRELLPSGEQLRTPAQAPSASYYALRLSALTEVYSSLGESDLQAGLSRSASADPMTALGLDLESHGMWREAQECWHAAMLRAHSRFMVSFQSHRKMLNLQREQESKLAEGWDDIALAQGSSAPAAAGGAKGGKGSKGGKRATSKKPGGKRGGNAGNKKKHEPVQMSAEEKHAAALAEF